MEHQYLMECKEERRGLLQNLKAWVGEWFSAYQQQGGKIWKNTCHQSAGQVEEPFISPSNTLKHLPEGFDLILLEGREDWFRVALAAPPGVSLQAMAELCADLAADGAIVFGRRLLTIEKASLRAHNGRLSVMAGGKYFPVSSFASQSMQGH